MDKDALCLKLFLWFALIEIYGPKCAVPELMIRSYLELISKIIKNRTPVRVIVVDSLK